MGERFANDFRSSHLFMAQESRVIEHAWSERRNAWQPSWVVADVRNGPLQALDVDMSARRLWVFTKGFVTLQDLSSGQSCGTWELPPEVQGAGCARPGGKSLLLLGSADGSHGLLCAELRGTKVCDPIGSAATKEAETMPGEECQVWLKSMIPPGEPQ